MARIDPKVFNTDPKHEKDREEFDSLVDASVARLLEKKKKDNPPKPENENIFDALADWFGGK